VVTTAAAPVLPRAFAAKGARESMSETPASDLLRACHRKMETHLDALLDALKHLEAKRVPDIRREFSSLQALATPHFEQEESVFYPHVRPLTPQLLDQMDQEHGVVRETEQALGDLLSSLPSPPEQRNLDELYRLGIEFHDAVEVHILDEEDLLLTFADRVLTADEQNRLATAMGKV
jgi:hemerythrin-like domain-containing protein